MLEGLGFRGIPHYAHFKRQGFLLHAQELSKSVLVAPTHGFMFMFKEFLYNLQA